MKNDKQEKLSKEIEEIERALEELPIGSISRKRINGKIQYYHQWYENGEVKSKYVHSNEIKSLQDKMQMKKRLKTKLSVLKSKRDNAGNLSLKAGVSIPIEINAYYDGGYLIPERRLRLKPGQRITVIVLDNESKRNIPDLEKYVNSGERLFDRDAQEVIKEGRSEERFI